MTVKPLSTAPEPISVVTEQNDTTGVDNPNLLNEEVNALLSESSIGRHSSTSTVALKAHVDI